MEKKQVVKKKEIKKRKIKYFIIISSNPNNPIDFERFEIFIQYDHDDEILSFVKDELKRNKHSFKEFNNIYVYEFPNNCVLSDLIWSGKVNEL